MHFAVENINHRGSRLIGPAKLIATELENTRLRKALSDLTLDKLILQEAAPGKLLSPARRRACIEQVRA